MGGGKRHPPRALFFPFLKRLRLKEESADERGPRISRTLQTQVFSYLRNISETIATGQMKQRIFSCLSYLLCIQFRLSNRRSQLYHHKHV